MQVLWVLQLTIVGFVDFKRAPRTNSISGSPCHWAQGLQKAGALEALCFTLARLRGPCGWVPGMPEKGSGSRVIVTIVPLLPHILST